MKKAFCEPRNIEFCPPIRLASVFAFGLGQSSLQVNRPDEHGGNKEYTTVDELEKDFADESLHPGDLKAVLTPVMVGVLDKLADAIKKDKTSAQAAKNLKAFAKKKK
jgi:tyrosyl-tRNA synthetase